MKILFCANCTSFRSFSEDPAQWRFCDCRQMAARWEDPNKGTVWVLAQMPANAFILGMNNNFLSSAVIDGKGRNYEDWRKAHNFATLAPDHLFDAHRRACWAVIIRVGETTDIKWHPAQVKVAEGKTLDECTAEEAAVLALATKPSWPDKVYSRDECVHLYCPTPEICKAADKCEHPIPTDE